MTKPKISKEMKQMLEQQKVVDALTDRIIIMYRPMLRSAIQRFLYPQVMLAAQPSSEPIQFYKGV